MYDLSDFEVTEDGEFIVGGAIYSLSEFLGILSQYFLDAPAGTYQLIEPEG